MKKKLNYKIIVKKGKIIDKSYQCRSKFKPIPIILTLGRLYHNIIRGDTLVMYYSYYPESNKEESKMKLIYAISSKDSSIRNLRLAIKEFYMDGEKNDVHSFETLIVNPKLKNILIKNGWYFIKKSWFIGEYYKKERI